jgi:hypothetical protein
VARGAEADPLFRNAGIGMLLVISGNELVDVDQVG